MNKNILESLNYKITEDSEYMKTIFPIPYEVEVQMDNLFKLANKGKKAGIKRLTRLIEQYPNVPALKTYLSILYSNMGNDAKAYEVNHGLLEKHPNHTLAIINLAMEYYKTGQIERIPELLGETFDWKTLFPHRDTFHVFEVSGLQKIAVIYYSAIGNLEEAKARLDIITELDVRDDLEVAKHHYITAEDIEYRNIHGSNIRINVAPTKLKNITKPPVFNSELITYLYNNNLEIDKEILAEILNYSTEEIITDLNRVLTDSINRFKYFREVALENGYNDKELSFLLHAIFLLGELESKESLESLFNILSQEYDFIEFYIGIIVTEDVWSVIYKIGQNQLSACKKFIMKPAIDSYNKGAVSIAVSQIALHQPERRAEVIEWFRDVFTFFLNSKIEDNVIDSILLELLINNMVNINGKELLPLIEELYEKKIVDISTLGDFEKVKELLINPDNSIKYEILSIYEIYDKLNSWGDEFKDSSIENNDDTIDRLNETNKINDEEPIARETRKIGRNEPCPCGSGKKYKKCCLKKTSYA